MVNEVLNVANDTRTGEIAGNDGNVSCEKENKPVSQAQHNVSENDDLKNKDNIDHNNNNTKEEITSNKNNNKEAKNGSKVSNQQMNNELLLGKFFEAFELPVIQAIKSGSFERKNPFTTRPGDVFVVGPIKAGTTWVQHILNQLRTGGNMDFEDIFEITWWLPFFFQYNPDLDYTQDQIASPRIIKCHEPYKFIPKGKGVKYVFVTRNEQDVMWSMMRFINGLYGIDGGSAISEALATFQLQSHSNKLIGGMEIVGSWWQHREDADVLWLHYDDLQKDLGTCIRKMAEFSNIPMDEELFKTVLHQSSFEFMKEHKEKFMGGDATLGKALKIDNYAPKIGTVRPDGGVIGQGTKNLPQKVTKLLRENWDDVLLPATGCTNYVEFYEKGSLLNRLARKDTQK